MIKDIPSLKDFVDLGLTFLNMALDNTMSLSLPFYYAGLDDLDDDDEMIVEFWKSSQKSLSNSLALTQQGIEFILKGLISSVSPYLLLSGNISDWPSKCDAKDTNFSDFRTIDAQDLIKVLDTVSNFKLSEEFKSKFSKLRRLRNTIIHTVDKRLIFSAKEIIETILYASHSLIGEQEWFTIRRNYLENKPESIAFSDEMVHNDLVSEAFAIIEILDNKQNTSLILINDSGVTYA